MRKNKIGSIFLISVLALAGIGISYAGFTSSVSVYGTVSTATVHLEVTDWFSGTYVYKIWGFTGTPTAPPGTPVIYDTTKEILVYSDFVQNIPTEKAVVEWAEITNGGHALLVSHSVASGVANGYDVNMEYYNLFPCIDFSADFIVHYSGSIPAKINVATIASDNAWLQELWAYHAANPGFGAWVQAYRCYPITDKVTGAITGWTISDGQQGRVLEPVDVGYQLHDGNYVYVKLIIHLPQDNTLQHLSGSFTGNIGVIQWDDACAPGTPVG